MTTEAEWREGALRAINARSSIGPYAAAGVLDALISAGYVTPPPRTCWEAGMSKIVVTEEMRTAGAAQATAYFMPLCYVKDGAMDIYRAMAALDPNRRAPSVTREEIAAAAWDANHPEAGRRWQDDHVRSGGPSTIERVRMLRSADAILALIGSDK